MSSSTLPLRAARALAAALVISALGNGAASAQALTDTRLGVAAGVASIARAGTGAYLSGVIDWPLATPGRALRMEGALGWWPVEADRDWSNHVWSFGAAAMQSVGRGAVQPYAIAGAAMYISDEREPLAGLNGGVGVRMRLGGSVVIAESRVHRRLAAIGGRMFVPLTIGMTF